MLELFEIKGNGAVNPPDLLFRLAAALLFGFAVAWIYRRTRKATEITASFPTTLVLLSVLIAMVTQVIGDNVARAFSLVGALSIVRFRTVVRDTQDTAYVIFAVVVGMAVGANNLWVGAIGLLVVGLAAFLMSQPSTVSVDSQPAFILTVRMGIGHDLEKVLLPTFAEFLAGHELISISTAKGGLSVDLVYEARFLLDRRPNDLLKTLNKIEGAQSVEIKRRSIEID